MTIPSAADFRNRRTSSHAGRISNRQRLRNAAQAEKWGLKAYMALLAVLAQRGGEVTVTAGTIKQIEGNFANLSYKMIPSPVSGEFIVRLVEGDASDATSASETDQTSPAQEAVSAATAEPVGPDSAATSRRDPPDPPSVSRGEEETPSGRI